MAIRRYMSSPGGNGKNQSDSGLEHPEPQQNRVHSFYTGERLAYKANSHHQKRLLGYSNREVLGLVDLIF